MLKELLIKYYNMHHEISYGLLIYFCSYYGYPVYHFHFVFPTILCASSF